MNGLVVNIEGLEKQPTLVTIVRRDESGDNRDPCSCHLFAYTGAKSYVQALRDALNEYLDIAAQDDLMAEDDITWFDMMAEYEDYGKVFAKHGLVEVMIPQGMASFAFDNDHLIKYYAEED